MVRCFECGKEMESSLDHYFCGYGYAVQYCAAYCPREYDGTTCEGEHPETSV